MMERESPGSAFTPGSMDAIPGSMDAIPGSMDAIATKENRRRKAGG